MKRRYRRVPPFSQAIRSFTNNASEMNKLAAWDFEDLLQVTLHSISMSLTYLQRQISVLYPSILRSPS
jgi:hypothetical protein